MYLYTKLSAYILNDALIECDNLLAGCASSIDKHERLTVVYASPSERCALPSALFYHPSSRNLDMVSIHYVMRHSFVLRSEAFVNIAPYNRVHKEAACIASHLRIGELSLAYIDNGLTQLLSCRLTDALLLKRMANIAIVKIRTEVEREAISDVSNHIMVFPLVLEAALTIGIAAVFVRELHHIAGSNLHSLNFRNQVLGFSTVCTDVLHRTCAHFARYKREILCSMPSFSTA